MNDFVRPFLIGLINSPQFKIKFIIAQANYRKKY